jgi:cardiolipin synthase
VKLYEYEPGFVHAKVIVADDEMAIVGSSNMDYRSFYLHYECGAYLYHNSAIPHIRKDVKETLLKCIEVDFDSLKKEKWIGRIVGGLLRLVAPLM